MTLEQARQQVRDDRKLVEKGIDPRQPVAAQQPGAVDSFGYVVGQFVELYCKPNQRTWQDTQRVLTKNCATLLDRRMADITRKELYALLDRFVADGHLYKAKVTHAWLRTLYRWAVKREHIAASPMEGVDKPQGRRKRTRWFKDDEVVACWRAAEQLSPVEGAYVKLLMLLAPRKSALAGMTRADLKFDDSNNPTTWVTPFELTKSRKTAEQRTYTTPLPPLATRILKGVLRADSELVFSGLRTSKALKAGLVAHGAPADFMFHTWRHTVATFLETAGRSEWERGLVLNHSGNGVTAGYSHGSPTDLKRELLCLWADHVQGLVRPQGAALLR